MTDRVIDASVALAYLRGESGWETAESILAGGFMCCVNYAEVIAKLIDRGATIEIAAARAAALACEIYPSDADLALDAGALRAGTRHLGLSLGDRFCLALARRMGLPVYTADKTWMALAGSVDVRLIR